MSPHFLTGHRVYSKPCRALNPCYVRLCRAILLLPLKQTEDRMSATEKVNILMVDDHPDKLLTYEVILSELGENLIKATSGRKALEQLLKNDIAVVLLDVNMPIKDGFER